VQGAVDSLIENASSVISCCCGSPMDNLGDIMRVAAVPSNRDSVTIKMASQMPSDAFLAYHGITKVQLGALPVLGCTSSLLGIEEAAANLG
jgi:hypothetical protein